MPRGPDSPRRVSLKLAYSALIAAYVQVAGLFFFTRGFLLTRNVLSQVASCTPEHANCWTPAFSKTVLVIIDALRYDFVVPPAGTQTPHQQFHNAFTFLHEQSQKHPESCFLAPFIADPPTTTLQRLKGLTTGSLPTFVDAGSNFSGEDIDEDNWLGQLAAQNKSIAFVGDNTWTALFHRYINPQLSFPYDSFNVRDLHTVDNGVLHHIFPLINSSSHKWDVLIAHTLGVDHAGHRYGPNHPEMRSKLVQMDSFIRDLVQSVSDDTLLLVMGDHGMDPKGDHGGESDPEVTAALWMYSKRPFFGAGSRAPVPQIDLVPTISLLLGLPIPFNNLGKVIPEAFVGPGSDQNLARLSAADHLTAIQIHTYRMHMPSLVKDPLADSLWLNLTETPESDFLAVSQRARAYQDHVMRVCRRKWVQFDHLRIVLGFLLTALSLWLALAGSLSFTTPRLVAAAAVATAAAASPFTLLESIILGSCLSLSLLATRSSSNQSISKCSSLDYVGILVTLVHAVLLSSNSFVVWEDRITDLLLTSAGFVFLLAAKGRLDCIANALVLIACTRLAALSNLCREEQLPHCVSTFYASPDSSVSSLYSPLLLIVCTLALPRTLLAFYTSTNSDGGVARPWILTGLRYTMLASTAYWTLETLLTHGFLKSSEFWLLPVMYTMARTVMGLGLVAANYVWFSGSSYCTSSSSGVANVGSSYFLLVLNVFVVSFLVAKPVGMAVLSLQIVQILTLLELVAQLDLRNNYFTSCVFLVLGYFFFFKTGHQATLASIQWDAGFVPGSTITFPLTHLAILFNTCSALIITALAVPLQELWRRPSSPNSIGLLKSVYSASVKYFVLQTILALATMSHAYFHRRHLMLWKVFAPRFMFAGVALLVTDLVLVVFALVFASTTLILGTGSRNFYKSSGSERTSPRTESGSST